MSKFAFEQANPDFEVTQAVTTYGESKVRANELLAVLLRRNRSGKACLEQGIILDLGHLELKCGVVANNTDGTQYVEVKAQKDDSPVGKAYTAFLKTFNAVDPQNTQESESWAATNNAFSTFIDATVTYIHFLVKNDLVRKNCTSSLISSNIHMQYGALFNKNISLLTHCIQNSPYASNIRVRQEGADAGVDRMLLDLLLNDEEYTENIQNRTQHDIDCGRASSVSSGRLLSARVKNSQRPFNLAINTEPASKREGKVPTSIILAEMLDHSTASRKNWLGKIIQSLSIGQYSCASFAEKNLVLVGDQPGGSNPGKFLVNKDGDALLVEWTKENADKIANKDLSKQARDIITEDLLLSMNLTLVTDHAQRLKYIAAARLMGRTDVAMPRNISDILRSGHCDLLTALACEKLGFQLRTSRQPLRQQTFFQTMMNHSDGRACFYSACFLAAAAISTGVASAVLAAATASFAAAMANPLILGLFIAALVTVVAAAAPSAFIIHKKHPCKHRILSHNPRATTQLTEKASKGGDTELLLTEEIAGYDDDPLHPYNTVTGGGNDNDDEVSADFIGSGNARQGQSRFPVSSLWEKFQGSDGDTDAHSDASEEATPLIDSNNGDGNHTKKTLQYRR